MISIPTNFLPKADVLLIRAGRVFRAFNATANTAAARGVALRAVAAASTSGDVLQMGPGTFNIDGTQAKLEIPAGVQLSGRGIDVTTIQSAWTSSQIAEDATLTMNSGVKLTDFTFHNTSTGFAYSIGRVSDATLVVGCVLRRIKIYAPNAADAFYHWQDATGSSYYLYDCQMYSGWDCIAMPDSDAGDTLYAENCYFETTGANFSGTTQGCVANVNVAMEFVRCRFKARGNASGNVDTYGVAIVNGSVKLSDCHFDVSAADGTVEDLGRGAGSGTFEVSGGSGSGTNGAYTTTNVTPTRKGDVYAGIKRAISVQMFGPTTDVAVGDGAVYFVVPAVLNGYNLASVHTRVVTAGTTNLTSVQVTRDRGGSAVAMLSTVCSIDSAETGSDTAAAPAVINTGNDDLATLDVLRFDVTAVQTTAPKGLICTLEFTKP